MKYKSRKIVEKIPDEQVQKDLERYRKMAIKLGATDSKTITSDMIVIDERVRAKCMYPKCPWYGTNPHCPPYAIDLKASRELVRKFNYGIFVDIRVPANLIVGSNVADTTTSVSSGLKLYEIVSRIESEAFYDGYYLALGFAVGPCKKFYCPNVPCNALKIGQPCRHALRSRPSMESMGIDAYALACKVGWDIYPIGKNAQPSSIACGHRLGLILIH